MAKRRYRRYRRARGKWAANIKRIAGDGVVSANTPFVDYITVAQNPEQEDTAVSQIFRVKNIEIACQVETQKPQVENLEYYIMYVPEGYPLPEDRSLPIKHPEWIMAYKFIGNATSSSAISSSSIYLTNENAQVPRIRTRLTRKLQSGDQIVFVVCGYNKTTDNLNVFYNGLLRWWTKAN